MTHNHPMGLFINITILRSDIYLTILQIQVS